MSKKLTPWFPGDVKPVRVGYYVRDWYGDGDSRHITPDFWSGDSWETCYAGGSRERAEFSRQSMKWRGLATPASKEVA